jgi:lysophospholipase L1-like esterase
MAAFVFVATIAEIALRLNTLRESAASDPRCAGADTAQSSQKGMYVLDPAAGYTMRANLCVRLRTPEYDEVVRTNSRGFVGPEVPSSKQPGELRIVVLGDSFAVGGQVPEEETFPAVLERDLSSRGYSGVRVINTGVGGYSTFNEAGVLRENLDWLQPDVVIVAAYLGNDVAENVLATAAGYVDDPGHPKGLTFGPRAAELVRQSVDWFPRNQRAVAATELASRNPVTAVRAVGHQMWETARIDSLVLGALFGTPPDPGVNTAPGARPRSTTQRLLNLTSFEWTLLSDPPHVSSLDRAWPLFGDYLAEIRATADSVNAQVLVVIIPQIAQVEPAERARTMADYDFADNEVDWERPQRELVAQANRADIAVLDLLPLFEDAADPDALYLPIDQHFTAEGHRLTADLIARDIVRLGWVR